MRCAFPGKFRHAPLEPPQEIIQAPGTLWGFSVWRQGAA
jgi:hypothetical protein